MTASETCFRNIAGQYASEPESTGVDLLPKLLEGGPYEDEEKARIGERDASEEWTIPLLSAFLELVQCGLLCEDLLPAHWDLY